MKLLIEQDDGTTTEIRITDAAMKQVRASFNPSTLPRVDLAKLLGAALISVASDGLPGEQPTSSDGARCAAVARTNIEQGTMWAVKALTA